MQQTNKITFMNWEITSKESGLSSSEEIEGIAEQNKLFRPPTIIFGKNELLIRQASNTIAIHYSARQALKYINYEVRKKSYCEVGKEGGANSICYIPEKLQVKHAAHWKTLEKPKDIQITQIKQSSDTFFITPFRGLVQGNAKVEKVKHSVIPIGKLGQGNTITNYFQGSLYEDQLDDNGLIQYQYKFRTMTNSWFALIRCYARIDEVSIHILDTRIYWEEGWNKIARQFNVRKGNWAELKDKFNGLQAGWTMNPNQSHLVYQHLHQVLEDNEYLHFK